MRSLFRLCLLSGPAVGLVCATQLMQPAAAHGHTYVVRADETLSAIALRFHTSPQHLAQLNGVGDPDRLRTGQLLRLPDERANYGPDYEPRVQAARDTRTASSYRVPRVDASSYLVQPGDSLSAVAQSFGVSIATLAAANGIASPDMLRVGQYLTIPGASAAQTTLRSSAIRASQIDSVSGPTAVATFSGAPAVAGTSALSAQTASRAQVGALLTSAAQSYGVSASLVKAVAWQESGWRMVVSRDGGIGVMQLMPATAAWLGPALFGRAIDPYSLSDNIRAGVALLASYVHRYGDVQLALAAYNAGPQSMTSGIPASTRSYIASVLALQAGFGG